MKSGELFLAEFSSLYGVELGVAFGVFSVEFSNSVIITFEDSHCYSKEVVLAVSVSDLDGARFLEIEFSKVGDLDSFTCLKKREKNKDKDSEKPGYLTLV